MKWSPQGGSANTTLGRQDVPQNDLSIVGDNYAEAARMFNTYRKKGIQGSHFDFLICADSKRH